MKRLVIFSFLAPAIFLLQLSTASAHCQVPCGIYADHARVHGMEEDAQTIAKATTQIQALSDKTDAQSINQRTRWITTKEAHASNIIKVVSEYFLTQKIKAASKGDEKAWNSYIHHLVTAHHVMRAAMKTKQVVDGDAVANLKAKLATLGALYPAPKK
jgi:nickel superoxide dismutase